MVGNAAGLEGRRGGQIENIARKRFITTVLGGNDASFEQICEFCKEEVLQENDIQKIGF